MNNDNKQIIKERVENTEMYKIACPFSAKVEWEKKVTMIGVSGECSGEHPALDRVLHRERSTTLTDEQV